MAKDKVGTNGPSTNSVRPAVSSDQREQMIAEAAYYRALQRGFSGGDPVEDWLQAEREINGIEAPEGSPSSTN